MWIVTFLLLVATGILLFTKAENRQNLAYNVIGAQEAYMQYEYDVQLWVKEKDQSKLEMLWYDIERACKALVDPMFHNSDRLYSVCRLNVCFQTWIPFSSCL